MAHFFSPNLFPFCPDSLLFSQSTSVQQLVAEVLVQKFFLYSRISIYLTVFGSPQLTEITISSAPSSLFRTTHNISSLSASLLYHLWHFPVCRNLEVPSLLPVSCCQSRDALHYLSLEHFCSLAEVLKAFLCSLDDDHFSYFFPLFLLVFLHWNAFAYFAFLPVTAPSVSLLSPENCTCLSWLILCYNVKVKIPVLLSKPHATLLCLRLISFPCIPQLTFHIPHSPLTLLLLLSSFHALIFALSFMLPMCLEQSLASQPIYSFA